MIVIHTLVILVLIIIFYVCLGYILGFIYRNLYTIRDGETLNRRAEFWSALFTSTFSPLLAVIFYAWITKSSFNYYPLIVYSILMIWVSGSKISRGSQIEENSLFQGQFYGIIGMWVIIYLIYNC